MTSPDTPLAAVPPSDPWAPPSVGAPDAAAHPAAHPGAQPASARPAPTPSAPPAAAAPWPGAEWAFPTPPPPPSTNAWAVVALVTGLIGLVPVAVPAGITGIVQTTRRRQAGRRLAIGGLVAATLWAGAAVALVLTLGSSWDPRLGTPADVGTVAVGDCLDAPADGSASWTSASCSDAHDAEVYVVEDLEDSAWPGDDAVAGSADDSCHGAFSGYVGRSWFTSAHDYGWFSPREQEWDDGDTRVVCVIVPYDDDVLRSPVRGSGD